MINILFLYHHPCTDGFLSRIIAHCFYERVNPDASRIVTYVGVNPSTLAADLQQCLARGRKFDQIRMFDVSLGPEHYEQLRAASADVLVFDHHESTLKQFSSLPQWLKFDNSRCGAHLAFRYYFGSSTPVPDIVRYVEVRDLWLYGKARDLPHSKAITTYLYAEPFALPFKNVEQYEYLLLDTTAATTTTREHRLCVNPVRLEQFWKEAREKGERIMQEVEEKVDAIVRTMVRKTFTLPDGNATKLVALVAKSDVYASEIGNKATTTESDVDFALIWCNDEENRIRISLRSNATRCNVNEVARLLWKGGGHAAAAGALISDTAEKQAFLTMFA